jgi:hypothetical protein
VRKVRLRLPSRRAAFLIAARQSSSPTGRHVCPNARNSMMSQSMQVSGGIAFVEAT